jgi:UDP-N-acetylglucosamine 2-epimerase (non-hydrolysing)
MKRKILIVFGTRPEAIKFAPLIDLFKGGASGYSIKVCVTAQHRQMLDQVLAVFGIVPDYDMNLMAANQNLFDITSGALMGLQEILLSEKPDLVMVQGDTTTSFVASLAAFYLKIPIAHVEAGLRTHRKYEPFPEEKNRQLTTVLVDYHFVPTAWARENLLMEGIQDTAIWITGNTVVDALLQIDRRISGKKADTIGGFMKATYGLHLKGAGHRIILVTGHRRENFGEGFRNICLALREIAEKNSDAIIVYPVHLNPNVQEPVNEILGGQRNVYLIEPQEYDHFVYLMKASYFILTDSGGIQEEAPSLGKPVLVMRNTTERPEGVSAGVVKLVGTDRKSIVETALGLLTDEAEYRRMSTKQNPYGDGNASARILAIVDQVLS